MNKIYSTQPFIIELSYDELPGAISSAKIKFRRPNLTEGSFTGVVDLVNKKVSYTSGANETLGSDGSWVFWNSFLISGWNTEFPGEPVNINIFKEGK